MNHYWTENDDRVKQFWYVSYCLMVSSVQDRLTGLALLQSGNLNWATTAFYYSGIHAGRLVCFVCFGDYLKGHESLAELLAPTRVPKIPNPPRRFRFTWLDEFLRYVRYVATNGGSTEQSNSIENTSQDRADLIKLIDANLPGVRPLFDRFAPLLARFRNLRNDCNYESLLVANEVYHSEVPTGFKELVAAADATSRIAVELAVDTYLWNLQSATCFERERDKFHAVHSRYLRGHLAERHAISGHFDSSLYQKFKDSGNAKEELRRIMGRLDWPATPAPLDVEGFIDPIMSEPFGEKRGLMKRWRDDIRALQIALSETNSANGIQT